jgi:large subunit ribosomal protein L24
MARTKQWIKKDDLVEIISGRERGKKGKVLAVFPEEERVTIEKLNMVKRHTKASQQNKQGGILEKEAWMHISNVMLLDNDGKRTRVKWKKLEDGKRVRIAARTGEVLDK